MVRLFVTGFAGTGKDTVADILSQRYGLVNKKFASSLYAAAEEFFGMTTKDRKLLQSLGAFGRAVDRNFWVNRCLDEVDNLPGDCPGVVITDCRFINEFNTLVNSGFIGIHLTADIDTRFERLKKRDGSVQENTLNDVSETEHLKFADNIPVKIHNNGSIEALADEVCAVYTKAFMLNAVSCDPTHSCVGIRQLERDLGLRLYPEYLHDAPESADTLEEVLTEARSW